jgi:hypothetical protein
LPIDLIGESESISIEPMYPAAPVIRTLMVIVTFVHSEPTWRSPALN